MKELEEYCVHALASILSKGNWTRLLLLSDLYMSSILKKRVLEYVRQNKRDIVKQKGWAKALQGQPTLHEEIMRAVVDT
jgi:hypothetical protein